MLITAIKEIVGMICALSNHGGITKDTRAWKLSLPGLVTAWIKIENQSERFSDISHQDHFRQQGGLNKTDYMTISILNDIFIM